MDVELRRMTPADIDQVIEIEREAFAPLFMGASLKRDVNNKYARYLVAFQPDSASPDSVQVTADLPALPVEAGDESLWGRMVRGVREMVGRQPTADSQPSDIAGYVGLWFQGNETHITEIAVREEFRGRGIGELLLIGSVRVAMEHGSTVLTLEARVSNFIAQRLYEKYGFKEVGIRKNYYSDNREDAVIMTTSPIHTAEYQEKFRGLQETYLGRWGDMKIEL
jgi:ribosomal-protein-alanine N-acetyltransferase